MSKRVKDEKSETMPMEDEDYKTKYEELKEEYEYLKEEYEALKKEMPPTWSVTVFDDVDDYKRRGDVPSYEVHKFSSMLEAIEFSKAEIVSSIVDFCDIDDCFDTKEDAKKALEEFKKNEPEIYKIIDVAKTLKTLDLTVNVNEYSFRGYFIEFKRVITYEKI